MNYYRLRVLADNNNAYIDKIELTKDNKNKIIDGILLDLKSTSISIKNKSKQIPDFIGHSADSPVISDKIKAILETLSDKDYLQFIPCSISNIQLNMPYWLLNITENIEAMDRSKSQYSTFEEDNEVDEISSLVLNEKAINNRTIFRIKEAPFHIFVSESLKNTLEASNITGLWFIKNMDLTTNKEVE